MEEELELPVPYSTFTRKTDAAYDGDPDGDYVMSEDVNELQESIERLERIIKIEALENTVSDELDKKVDRAAISDFGSPLFINYNGSSIGVYPTIEQRISAFAYIPRVMLKKESSANFDFFVTELNRSGTRLYGIINCSGVSLTLIESDISWFKQKNFAGILLTGFGFENGLTRSQQNQLLRTIRSLGMTAIVTGEIDTTLFGKPHSNNPQQETLELTSNDFYLAKDIFVLDGVKNNPLIISSLTFDLNKAQKELGIQILIEDTADATLDNNNLYLYGKMLSTLYNIDGYSLVPKSRYALNERVERYLHGFELGQWKTTNPIFVEDSQSTTRRFAKGTVVFDKINNNSYIDGVGLSPTLYTWKAKQIPGSAVDLETADINNAALGNIVNAINQGEHLIHFSKIDGMNESGLSPSMISDSVIRAINTSPAAYEKNPDGGFDAFAGNQFIHGALIDYLDASAIKTGTLSIDAIKANLMEALVANIGTAYIDNALIGELEAEHITASVVEAINIYAKTAAIETAVIDVAAIGALTADHIKGVVVDAIKLYAGDAKIESAQIGALKASNIEAGMIEALNISAGNAQFDNLKAAVIDAINASIQHAFIDGAIINEGTIQEAQIADGSITDAKIVDLTANKIVSGTIDTGRVTLRGDNGHLRINGNKLQVFDDQPVPIERVVLGDVDNDGSVYGFRVRGADGTTVLYDETGVYEQGITDGAITNPKIADDAVDGGKHIHADTITGDKLVVDSITGREIRAKSILANHLMTNTITAESGVIARGAIGEAEIAEASIGDLHVKEVSASKLTAGSIEMTSRNLVANATFRKGLLDWEIDSGWEIADISDLVKLNQTRSIHLFSTGEVTSGLLGIHSEFTPVSPNEKYAGSVYALSRNRASYDSGGPRVEIEFHNDTVRLDSVMAQITLSKDDEWERLTLIGTVPVEATRMRLRLSHVRNGDTFFSRPMIQKGNIVTEWTGDGSYLTEDGIYTGDIHADQLTVGKIRADMIMIGPETTYADGHSPTELREEMEDRIPYKVEVFSTNGNMFQRGQISTTLQATVYRGGDEVTHEIDASRFIWSRIDVNGVQDTVWSDAHKGMKNVPITRNDVFQRATFVCEIMEI